MTPAPSRGTLAQPTKGASRMLPPPPPPPPPALVTPAPPAPLPTLPPWALGPFSRRDNDQPVISPNPASTFPCPMRGIPIHWEALHTFNPAAIVKDNKVFLLYRAEDDTGEMTIGHHTSRLGLAQSTDGITFTRLPAPVLFPDNDNQKDNEWDGGCEDPRLVESPPTEPPEKRYVLTYTQWNRKVPRLAIATSPDLLHWTKHGPAFSQMTPTTTADAYRNMPSKSGSIVCAISPDATPNSRRLKAVRLKRPANAAPTTSPRSSPDTSRDASPNPSPTSPPTTTADNSPGDYLMYWGEGAVHLAHSPDLIHWQVLEDSPGQPTAVLSPLPNTFDSPLLECGPPALLTTQGILLLYNAKNDGHHNIPSLAPNAYAAGQALFSTENPAQLLARLPTPFLKPERPWERTGQYPAGTTFIEALVLHQNRWMLYYGSADSLVGVVSTNPIPPTNP